MRLSSIYCLLFGTLCLTGCFSLDTGVSDITREEQILVSNYGWKLFDCIPLFCGNATEGTSGKVFPFVLFRDDVTMDKIQGRLMSYAARNQRQVDHLVYHDFSSVMLYLPMIGEVLPIPYVLTYRELQLSGVLK